MTGPFDAGDDRHSNARANGHDLNLPFQGIDPVWVEEPMLLSGGVLVLAVNVPKPDGSRHPGILFRFAKPDGSGFHEPPTLFAPDRPADLRALPAQVEQAVEHAIRSAQPTDEPCGDAGGPPGIGPCVRSAGHSGQHGYAGTFWGQSS